MQDLVFIFTKNSIKFMHVLFMNQVGLYQIPRHQSKANSFHLKIGIVLGSLYHFIFNILFLISRVRYSNQVQVKASSISIYNWIAVYQIHPHRRQIPKVLLFVRSMWEKVYTLEEPTLNIKLLKPLEPEPHLFPRQSRFLFP